MFRKVGPYFGTLLCVALLLLGPVNAFSQIVNRETNVAFLQQNAVELQQKTDQNRQRAFSMAKERGWETFRVTRNGTIIALQGIDELGLPVYFITHNNTVAAATTRTSTLYSGGGLSLSLSGSTLAADKAAIWDGGAVLGSHVEFSTSRIRARDNATTLSTHATHVAGTMMAKGVYAPARGMAFGLPQLMAFDFNNDVSEMSANAATLLISNHSYGSISGWQYNTDVTPARWEFWGALGANEDFKFGYYDDGAANWDRICYNAPYYLPVKSAGNSRNENGPAVGETYYRRNASGSWVNAGPRPEGIYSNNAYDILATSANAKNILTVGAINPLPFGPTSTSSIQISSFSSWGPTDDGRLKPDLVADGVSVTSTSSSGTSAYTTLSGTSMAAPNVSGSLLLLQELYSQRHAGAFMRSATLKALVTGTATEAGPNPGPDYIYGWGLLNMEDAAKAILNRNAKSLITESMLEQGGSQTINLIASGDGPLIATISWTDPEATAVAAADALDNPLPRLVNDLDIRIRDQQNNSYLPWVLDPANPATAATKGDNFRDNVEQIYIANATPGKSYTLTISHKRTLSKGPQAFSIVVTGIGGTTYCASAPASTADSKIINFKLANIDHTPNLNCTGYSDFTAQTISLERGKTYPFSISMGTCGANADKIAKVFVDWNGDGDFNDAQELAATTTVINGTGLYTGALTVPDGVNINNFSLLRVVLTEGSNATAVSACGIYTKGETQDYRVVFLNSSVDAALTAVTDPSGTGCANTQQQVRVTLKNQGTQTLTAIPVTVTVSDNGVPVATLTGIFQGSLPYLNEVEFILPGSFQAQAGKTYTLVASTTLTGDLNGTNNQSTGSFQVSTPPVAVSGTAAYCIDQNAYSLTAAAPAQSTLFWYRSLTDTQPLAFGPVTATQTAPLNNTYYVGLNDFKADIGPKTKAEVGDGGYNQFTPGISVSTLVPITLESARLYIGNSGQIRFTAVNSSGMAVSTVLLTVTATKTQPAAGATANDMNDQGQVYPLNLTLPVAGSYTINIEYLNGATIFRNNNATTATAYPYQTVLNLFSITGNTATQDNTPNYYKGFYYYFYELKVKSAGCIGGPRLAVTVNTPKITQTGNVLRSDSPTGNQWYLNGQVIVGATEASFTPLRNGSYTVAVSSAGTCTLRSDDFVVTFVRNKTNNEIGLTVYPVPTRGKITVEFEIGQATATTVRLTNLLGQTIFTDERKQFTGVYQHEINLSALPDGIYVLSVQVGTKAYTRKITLIK